MRAFASLNAGGLSAAEREHVTPIFYEQAAMEAAAVSSAAIRNGLHQRLVVDARLRISSPSSVLLMSAAGRTLSFAPLAGDRSLMAGPLGVAVGWALASASSTRMYARLPECEVRALVDLDGARAARLAKEFPGSAALTAFDDVLGDGIDIVARSRPSTMRISGR